ncbi:MAG: hypothetical protein ACI9HK_001562 [Pirellulaceae bacterium]|jgi:hypothetical protein
MRQNDLNRAVADATGETVTTIKKLGFMLAEPDIFDDLDDEIAGPLVIDWDELDAQRYLRNWFPEPHSPTTVRAYEYEANCSRISTSYE